MDKLVDTTVKLVEEGRLQQAVEVLQQGITLLTSTYPGRCAHIRVEAGWVMTAHPAVQAQSSFTVTGSVEAACCFLGLQLLQQLTFSLMQSS